MGRSNAGKVKTRVAVMGAGAVGSYFGGMLARAGVPVTLISRQAHVEAIRREKLNMDTVTFQERVAIEASTEPSAVSGADVVLFCVKTLDTEEAARSILPHLAPNAIVVSLQNGVDNVERIRAACGIDALPAVVYIAVSMPKPGHIKHSGRGELAVGELARSKGEEAMKSTQRTERISALFTPAGVPCRISEDIESDLWEKFINNCAGNAISAIAQCSYGQAASNSATRELMGRAIEETVAVARAAGVRLPETEYMERGLRFLAKIGDAKSSTAQDLARGKRTEIDSLNGYLARRGRELGVPTPVNFALYAMVKLLEEQGRSADSSS
jgi:2-dehydropantoate 2-reductase